VQRRAIDAGKREQPLVTRRLVVSAVNPTDGGTLTVLQDFVHAACETLSPEWDIVVFAHDRRLFNTNRPRFIEIRSSKRSWFLRMWTEWVRFRFYARTLAPDLWLSLHDMTPNLGSVRQAVYCHNPNPFYPTRLTDVLFQPTQLAFRIAYAWLYRVNLKRNCAIVVQQSWLREEFRKWADRSQQIIVAHPATTIDSGDVHGRERSPGGRATFIYPTLPRPFKNLELICRAVEHLEGNPAWRSEVIFTMDGTENRYAGWLKRKFGHCASIRFAGHQSRQQMRQMYQQADCLVFPSRMETWGLPITEAKEFRLPMLVANLPYARETVGSYDKVSFIDIDDHAALGRLMLAFQEGSLVFESAAAVPPEPPFVQGWHELVRVLTQYHSTDRQRLRK
jgi:glycosyltransferase involved in cell wall biosynthesis